MAFSLSCLPFVPPGCRAVPELLTELGVGCVVGTHCCLRSRRFPGNVSLRCPLTHRHQSPARTGTVTSLLRPFLLLSRRILFPKILFLCDSQTRFSGWLPAGRVTFRSHQWTSDDPVYLTILILLLVLFPLSQPLAHGLIHSFVAHLVSLHSIS